MATERSVRMVLHKLAVVRWDRLVEGERLARLRVDDKCPGAFGAPLGTVRCPGKAEGLCAGRARASPAHVEERDTHLERVVKARAPALWRPCQR